MKTLLLHGFGATPRAFDPMLHDLVGASSRVVRPALQGEGGSFEGEVDRVAALLDDAPHRVFGYSMGGRIALGLLARHPAKVGSLVLASAHPGLAEDERDARRRLDAKRAADLRAGGMSAFFERWDRQPLFSRRPTPDRSGLTTDALARVLTRLSPADMPSLWEVLGRSTVPLTYLVGEHDTKYLAVSRRISALRPDARVRVVAGADHDVLGCAPEVVREELERGCAQAPPPTSEPERSRP